MRSRRLDAEERLLQSAGLVDRHDQERNVSHVPEAVRRLRWHDEDLIRTQLGDLVPRGPATAPLEEDERLGIRVDVQLDELAWRRADDEDRDVDPRPALPLEQRSSRAELQVLEVEPGDLWGRVQMGRAGIEPATLRLRVSCSTS
jgi:hypothetical protein